MALHQFQGTVLTEDMERVISYILLQDPLPAYDYFQAVRDATELEGSRLPPLMMARTKEAGRNQLHAAVQRRVIVSFIDPQQRVEATVDPLHRLVRSFSFLAAQEKSDDPLPPLRSFVADYATFLARMCPLRGCTPALLRTIELAGKRECFSAFFFDRFFDSATGTSTLESCRASFEP